jgi:hypothetical protein
VTARGGTVTGTVIPSSRGCGWTAAVDVGSAGVMSVTDGNVGTGNGLVMLFLLSNTGLAPRTLTATVAGQSISVIQSGQVPVAVCGAYDVSGSVTQSFDFSKGLPGLFGDTTDDEKVYITNNTGSTLTNLYYVLRGIPVSGLAGGYSVSSYDVNGGYPSFTWGITTCYRSDGDQMLSLGNLRPGQTITLDIGFSQFWPYFGHGTLGTTLFSGKPNR